MEELLDYIEEIDRTNPYKIVCSNVRNKECLYKKVVIENKIISGKNVYQIERFTDKQAFHENIEEKALVDNLNSIMKDFGQMNTFALKEEIDLKISKKGKILINRRKVKGKDITIGSNNKKKKYILEEGHIIEPLIDLGVFTKEGKVVNSMYDKYKQINRFIEMVEDVLKNYKSDTLHIIDFGCGKSYLTFILYYYLVEIRHIDAYIIGLDLKETVIEKCNGIAKKYNYSKLKFELGDINGYKTDMTVDMVITLHACDTATDYALYNAVNWNAQIIMSVPCCQHEVNAQMGSEDLSIITKYGIVKERVAALMTDAIRANVLEYMGYKTNLLEFIDIAHSPKNILIRAVKSGVSKEKKEKARLEIENICKEFNITPTLVKLLMDTDNEIPFI